MAGDSFGSSIDDLAHLLDRQFRQQYPSGYGAGTSASQTLADARAQWSNSLEGLRTTLSVQAQINDAITADQGTLNQIVGFLSFGLVQPIDWLGDPDWAMFSIVLLSAWQAYGFQMIIYLAGLQGIPDELYDAARIDGASALRRFWHVTMPGLRPTHVFVLVITTIQAFKLYTQVAILTQGGPKESTETVVHYMVRAGFEEQKLGYASAVSVILFVIVLLIALLQRKLLRRFDV